MDRITKWMIAWLIMWMIVQATMICNINNKLDENDELHNLMITSQENLLELIEWNFELIEIYH